jgi:hypothetical protein
MASSATANYIVSRVQQNNMIVYVSIRKDGTVQAQGPNPQTVIQAALEGDGGIPGNMRLIHGPVCRSVAQRRLRWFE